MIDRLTSMAVFVKAAELGSFAAAAAATGLSAQMVGKHVGALEERLGAELIRRTTRRHSLTEVGQLFCERCRAILAETEAAEALAQDLGAAPRGRLRVNAPVTFGAFCLAPVVWRFLDAHPRVAVELTLSDRYVDLVGEGYDAVVRLGALDDSSLLARPLRPYRLVACASPGYLARRGTPREPEDLAEHDGLGFVYATGLPFAEWRFTRDGRDTAVRVRSRFECNDARVLRDAALAGHGIILQSERVLADDVAAGRLVAVLEDYAAPSRPMHVLFSPSRRRSSSLRLFVEAVVEAFG